MSGKCSYDSFLLTAQPRTVSVVSCKRRGGTEKKVSGWWGLFRSSSQVWVGISQGISCCCLEVKKKRLTNDEIQMENVSNRKDIKKKASVFIPSALKNLSMWFLCTKMKHDLSSTDPLKCPWNPLTFTQTANEKLCFEEASMPSWHVRKALQMSVQHKNTFCFSLYSQSRTEPFRPILSGVIQAIWIVRLCAKVCVPCVLSNHMFTVDIFHLKTTKGLCVATLVWLVASKF